MNGPHRERFTRSAGTALGAAIERRSAPSAWPTYVARQPVYDRDRNVVLYGHADGNDAWQTLLGDSPVQIRRGRVRAGEREEKGEGVGCLFVRPRPGSDRALVGVVAGTGLAGMRLTDRLPYFTSGVGYPDCLLVHLDKGHLAPRVAGFFGNDWGVQTGEFVWDR